MGDGKLDPPGLEDEEGVPWISLLKEELPLLEGHLLYDSCYEAEVFLREASEESKRFQG